jgi:hypothetical protein
LFPQADADQVEHAEGDLAGVLAVDLDPQHGVQSLADRICVWHRAALRVAVDHHRRADIGKRRERPDREPAVRPVGVDVGDARVAGRRRGRDVAERDLPGDAVILIVKVIGVGHGDVEGDRVEPGRAGVVGPGPLRGDVGVQVGVVVDGEDGLAERDSPPAPTVSAVLVTVMVASNRRSSIDSIEGRREGLRRKFGGYRCPFKARRMTTTSSGKQTR